MRGFLTLACFAMIFAGSLAAYTFLTNREPVTIPLAKYQKQKPPAKWLHLTDCELDLFGARHFNYIESDHAPEMLIPLRTPGATNAPVYALLSIRDDKLQLQIEALSLAEAVGALDEPAGTNVTRRTAPRDVRGLVRFGIELSTENRAELLSLHPGLAEDFVILDEGAKPSWLLALMLPAGLGLMLWLIVSSLRNFRKATAAPAGQSASLTPPAPSAPIAEKKKGAPEDAPDKKV